MDPHVLLSNDCNNDNDVNHVNKDGFSFSLVALLTSLSLLRSFSGPSGSV